MRGSAVFRTGIAPGGALAGPWVRNPLWTRARAVPSLDLRFADNKSLVDAVTGAQLVTFTRASSGTYVGSDGVLRSAVTNLLLRSEEFQTTWTSSQLLAFGSGSVTDATTAPNGTLTADRITENTATAQRFVSQGVSGIPASSVITVSCYVKFDSANRNFSLQLTDAPSGGSGYAELYLTQSGVVTSPTPSSFTNRTATVENVGSGWYRVRLTITTAAVTTITTRLFIVSSANAQSYTGDGTSGLFLWGAQLEQSAAVGEYIPTTSAINSAPRFDHNPTTGESLGLLVEEARTNSIPNNTGVGAVAGAPGTLPTNWTWNTAGGASTEVVGTGTENGIAYVDVRVFGTVSSAPSIQFVANTAIAATTGQTWTESFYCKIISLVSGTPDPRLRIVERSVAGSYLTEGNQTFTPGISSASLIASRFTFTRTLTNALTGYVIPALLLNQSSGAIDITLRIGLPQLEQGAFATSAIPTTTATVTRAADVASIGGSAFTSFYNQSEGTVFAECAVAQPNTGGNQFVFRTSDNTFNNAIAVNIPGQATLSTASGGVFDGNVASVASLTANVSAKIGAAYASNNLSISLNGATTVIDATATIPTALNRADIGSDHTGVNRVKAGTIKRLAFWPTRFGSEVLQRITQP